MAAVEAGTEAVEDMAAAVVAAAAAVVVVAVVVTAAEAVAATAVAAAAAVVVATSRLAKLSITLAEGSASGPSPCLAHLKAPP
jgi:hypothetical protein